ncbi:hypothetical protein AAKU61_003503 [Undibacterium sp. GrIS 1.2]|uniref:hypothetical protein n=1 Tax=Undibacterium sp. GrIS 1.2 TaxID=3143933 RepID=UPI0033997B34
MNSDFQESYKQHRKNVEEFWDTMKVDEESKAQFIANAVQSAIAKKDENQIELLIDATFEIRNSITQVDTLNHLLVIKGHHRHQEITMGIQKFAHPSSVSFINDVLNGGFDHLDYNCSDSDVIAKWFSHALFKIGTEEAFDSIRKFANSHDEGIRNEMQYRLNKIKT